MDKSAVLEILRQFRDELETLNVRAEKLVLYGSHSTGAAREDSDIDVVVISSDFSNKSYWERIDLLSEAIYKTSAPIEASAFTPEEWMSGKSLITDFAKNGVLVD